MRIRYIAPVVITLITVLCMGSLTGLFLWISFLGELDTPPLGVMLVLALVPVFIIAGVVLALVQRIREIGKGEEDDAKNY